MWRLGVKVVGQLKIKLAENELTCQRQDQQANSQEAECGRDDAGHGSRLELHFSAWTYW